MRRRAGLGLVVAVAAVLGVAVPAAPAATPVTMSGSRYQPRDVIVAAGGTVVWTNDDRVGHSVTADDGAFDSHPTCGTLTGTCLRQGESFSASFSDPGTFAYYCRAHGAPGGQGMAGTVTVTG